MKVPYRFDSARVVGTLTVQEVTLRQHYETAAWFRDHKVKPGEYPVFAKPNGSYNQLMYGVVLDTVITAACFQSLFGGVGYGEDKAGQREVGKESTYTIVEGESYQQGGITPFEGWTDFSYKPF
jgi:hypothetical protein